MHIKKKNNNKKNLLQTNQREKWSAEQQGSLLAAPASGTLQLQRQGNNQQG